MRSWCASTAVATSPRPSTRSSRRAPSAGGRSRRPPPRRGRGVVGGGGVAQRERLQQQPEHALVADVELVGPALDLLLVLLPAQDGAQQQLAGGERDDEQPD